MCKIALQNTGKYRRNKYEKKNNIETGMSRIVKNNVVVKT